MQVLINKHQFRALIMTYDIEYIRLVVSEHLKECTHILAALAISAYARFCA
jgi:hypothetical protein